MESVLKLFVTIANALKGRKFHLVMLLVALLGFLGVDVPEGTNWTAVFNDQGAMLQLLMAMAASALKAKVDRVTPG